jgi:guanosine-3',5'-bis(diphosphate) 3'-pyrophosphohydrolase
MRDGIYKKKFEDLIAVCRKNLRTVDEDLIRRAFTFSLEAHKQDLRASGEPYFNHPYEVAMIVAREIPLDDISVAAALLHDVAEDTDYEIKDVRQEFNDTIADIVDGATKISDIFHSHEVTKAESYRKLLLSMVNDIRVILLKFADRLHNMRTLQYLPEDRRERIAHETLDIYAPFAHRFGLAKIKWELEDLAFKYLQPAEYEEITRHIKSKRRERESYIRKFIQPIEKQLKEAGFRFETEGRPKSLFSIHSKMIARAKPIDEIYDLFAVRFILETEDNNECFNVYGIISAIYLPIPERFKNYISVPKKNGYQSLHATFIGPEGKMVEVQIRTRGMHEIAEKGVAAHWKYKGAASALDKELEDWINWVREILEQPEGESSATQLIESFKLNLYQDEIYVFTPKGELKILPKGATPVDFAYAVHTKVGFHCIGAKVMGRIVPLDHQLKSGDQIEIITSKNQTPNPDWEQFVVTHKAQSQIRKWVKEETRKQLAAGREAWEKRAKKHKLRLSDDQLLVLLRDSKFDSLKDFFVGIYRGEVDPEMVAHELNVKLKHPQPLSVKESSGTDGIFSRFVKTARSVVDGMLVYGVKEDFLHSYAQCCNPIPGDEIVGFVTVGEGIRIHRKNCRNLAAQAASEPNRIVEVGWPKSNGHEFAAAVHIAGQDRTGMLSDITHAISSYQNTNIRGVNIDTRDSLFDGTIMMFVKDTDHLQRIIDKLRKIKGVSRVERFEE